MSNSPENQSFNEEVSRKIDLQVSDLDALKALDSQNEAKANLLRGMKGKLLADIEKHTEDLAIGDEDIKAVYDGLVADGNVKSELEAVGISDLDGFRVWIGFDALAPLASEGERLLHDENLVNEKGRMVGIAFRTDEVELLGQEIDVGGVPFLKVRVVHQSDKYRAKGSKTKILEGYVRRDALESRALPPSTDEEIKTGAAFESFDAKLNDIRENFDADFASKELSLKKLQNWHEQALALRIKLEGMKEEFSGDANKLAVVKVVDEELWLLQNSIYRSLTEFALKSNEEGTG